MFQPMFISSTASSALAAGDSSGGFAANELDQTSPVLLRSPTNTASSSPTCASSATSTYLKKPARTSRRSEQLAVVPGQTPDGAGSLLPLHDFFFTVIAAVMFSACPTVSSPRPGALDQRSANTHAGFWQDWGILSTSDPASARLPRHRRHEGGRNAVTIPFDGEVLEHVDDRATVPAVEASFINRRSIAAIIATVSRCQAGHGRGFRLDRLNSAIDASACAR